MTTLKIIFVGLLLFASLLRWGPRDTLSGLSKTATPSPGEPVTYSSPDVRGVAVTGVISFRETVNVGTRNWSQFRGENAQPITARFDLPVRWSDESGIYWKTELPGRGTSSPIIHEGNTYVTAASGYGISPESPGKIEQLTHHLICLERVTGKYLWQRDIQGTPLTQPLNQQLMRHGFASSTPVTDGELIYAFFGASGVFAFEVSNGNLAWQADVGFQQNPFGSSASPVLYDQLLIVNASIENETVFAIDKKTGAGVWKIDNVERSWSTPVVSQAPDGSDELIIFADGSIRGFNPKTGKELWRCQGPQGNAMSTPFVQHGVCYFNGGTQRRLLAIRLGGRGDVTDTHLLWDVPAGASVSSPVYLTGHVYLMSDNGFFQCFDARTGTRINRLRTPSRSRVYASPLFAGDRFYLPLEDSGVIVCEATPEASLIHHNQFESDRHSLKASFSVSERGLFMRNDKFCYCLAFERPSNPTRLLTEFENQAELITPIPRFEFNQQQNQMRPYNHFLNTDRRRAYESILEPFQSILSWREMADLHGLIDENYASFEALRHQQQLAYWRALQSGLTSSPELTSTLEQIVVDVNRHVEVIRDKIKAGLSEEKINQLATDSLISG